jgi:Trk K+ transport system NAD-binding subunit
VAEGTARDLMRRAGADNLDDAFIALTGEDLVQDEELAAVGD